MNPRSLPAPTLANLYPPVRGYSYFEAASVLPFASEAEPQTAANIWWLAEHALLAYDQPATIEAALAPHGYRAECFADRASSTFAYAAIGADHGVLSFRGTEALTPGDSLFKLGDVVRDWLTDARFARRGFDDAGRVHAGFGAALERIWPGLESVLAQAPRWWCTGHSMGAALAALAAVRIGRRGNTLAALATFGQPRTGCANFALRLDALPCVRVVNACDLVPRMPPERLGFAHAGTLLHLDAEQFTRYGATVRGHLRRLPATLKHGVGALTPIELIDHAPLYYAIKCCNAALARLERPGAG